MSDNKVISFADKVKEKQTKKEQVNNKCIESDLSHDELAEDILTRIQETLLKQEENAVVLCDILDDYCDDLEDINDMVCFASFLSKYAVSVLSDLFNGIKKEDEMSLTMIINAVLQSHSDIMHLTDKINKRLDEGEKK